MATEDVTLRILADIKSASKSIDQFVNQTEKSLNTLINNTNFGKLFSANLLGGLSTLAIDKTIDGISFAFSGLTNSIRDGIQEAISYENSLNQLKTSFEATGIASEESLASFETFANSLEDTSKFTDDQIISNAALIQSLSRLDEQGLKRATQAAVDLASALGKDLGTTSELVAKAANGNIAAFSKLGIEIRKGKDDAETFENTLKALETRFGGAAQASLKTFSGSTTQVKNAFNDLIKEFGNLIISSPSVIGAITGVADELKKLTEVFKALSGKTDPFKNLNNALTLLQNINSTATEPLIKLLRVGEVVFNSLRLIIFQSASAFAEFGFTIDEFLNRIGVQSDETFGKAKETVIALRKEVANSADVLAESFGDLGNKVTIDDTINKSISNIKQNVESASVDAKKGFGEIANSATNAAIQIDAALANKIIEIAIRFTSPEETQAKLDEQLLIIQAAEEQKTLNAVEAQLARETIIAESEQRILDQQTQNAIIRGDLDKQNQTANLLFQQQILAERLKSTQLTSDQEIAIKKKQDQIEKQLLQVRLQQASTFFGDLSSLTQTKNKELFEIGKAAALANAIVNGFLAVQNALAVPPFPVGLALAAAAAVKAAVQISGIQAQSLATGITEVPRGFPNDTFAANLTSGERVLSVPQNQDLNRFLQSQDSNKASSGSDEESKSLLQAIVDRLGALENTIIVNVGPREIMREVREGIRSGQQVAV